MLYQVHFAMKVVPTRNLSVNPTNKYHDCLRLIFVGRNCNNILLKSVILLIASVKLMMKPLMFLPPSKFLCVFVMWVLIARWSCALRGHCFFFRGKLNNWRRTGRYNNGEVAIARIRNHYRGNERPRSDVDSNMAGMFSGVCIHIQTEIPEAHYVRCYGHCLDFAVVKSCQLPIIRNTMDTVNEISFAFSYSSKRSRRTEYRYIQICKCLNC